MTPRRRISLIAVLLAVAFGLVACGGDDDTSGDSSPDAAGTSATDPVVTTAPDDGSSSLPDPCGLLTVDELRQATGVDFPEGVRNEALSNESQVICDWVSEGPLSTAQVLVNDNGASFDEQRASVEDAFGEPAVDVDLADAAYRTTEGSLVAMKVGALFVQVSYIPNGPGNVADATVALAGDVLAHLG